MLQLHFIPTTSETPDLEAKFVHFAEVPIFCRSQDTLSYRNPTWISISNESSGLYWFFQLGSLGHSPASGTDESRNSGNVLMLSLTAACLNLFYWRQVFIHVEKKMFTNIPGHVVISVLWGEREEWNGVL